MSELMVQVGQVKKETTFRQGNGNKAKVGKCVKVPLRGARDDECRAAGI